MLKTFTRSAAALALIGSLAACDTTEPPPPNEEELITEVTLTLTNDDDANDVRTIVASDPDGDGAGITFLPSSLDLEAGATYSGTIELRDTINNEDITEEIEEEAEEHLFRYSISNGSVAITDSESDYTMEDENNGNFAVGLEFEVSVNGSASGLGTLGAILYHFDDEPKTGSTATSDEIDVDIDFPVEFGTVAKR